MDDVIRLTFSALPSFSGILRWFKWDFFYFPFEVGYLSMHFKSLKTINFLAPFRNFDLIGTYGVYSIHFECIFCNFDVSLKKKRFLVVFYGVVGIYQYQLLISFEKVEVGWATETYALFILCNVRIHVTLPFFSGNCENKLNKGSEKD